MTVKVPITNRYREVVAYALVDDADAWALRYRWHLTGSNRRYVSRGERRGSENHKFMLHREILGLRAGDGHEVDHINGNTLDNRRVNLRVCTRAENGQNVATRGGASSYRNVFYEASHGQKRWRARVILQGKRHHVGWFATEIEAADAARAWRDRHMPFAGAERRVV
jgi:hypothetical protein